MFRSLRTKLFASHVVTIVICLVLAGGLGLFWLQRYQREVALTRARVAAEALERTLRLLPTQETWTPALLLSYLRSHISAADGQLLFVSENGTILHSGPGTHLEGLKVAPPSSAALQRQSTKLSGLRWQSAGRNGYFLFYVPLPRIPETSPQRSSSLSPRYVVLAVPAEDVQRPWREWIPPLLGIGALALVISALASYFLFGPITQPISAMTRIAEEMAKGNYDSGPVRSEIPIQSQDEIGRLALAFNRMAQEVRRAQRMQRDFLANISHDLQTPLTSIRGFSQAMLEGAIRDPEGSRKAGSIIHEEAERMGRLVRNLLDLARLEAGQIETARIPVDLPHLLRLCFERFESQAEEVGVSFSSDFPDSLPLVSGDPDRLMQAFSNLIDNALKYTPAGGRVTIGGYLLGGRRRPPKSGMETTHVGAQGSLNNSQKELPLPSSALSDGRWVVITVTDTGIGIPSEEMSRIFEHFYRADKARAGKEGAGLGLAIAHEIIRAHGGYIRVSSRPHEGSRFHVALPVQAGDA